MAFLYYVSVEGMTQGQFKAESRKAGRSEKWFEAFGFRMGSSVPVDPKSGAIKGFREHKPTLIKKRWGAASPQLIQAHYTGEVLGKVVLEFVGRDSGGQKEKIQERHTLTEAVIVSLDRYSEVFEGDVEQFEDIGLAYRKIVIENIDASTSTSDDWIEPNVK